MTKGKINCLEHVASLLFVALQEAFRAEEFSIFPKDLRVLQQCDVVGVDLGPLRYKLAKDYRSMSDVWFLIGQGELSGD